MARCNNNTSQSNFADVTQNRRDVANLEVLCEWQTSHGQLSFEIFAKNCETDEDELLLDERHDVVVVLKQHNDTQTLKHAES